MSSQTDDTKYDVDQMLEALGSSTRREIIYWLKLRSYSISELAVITDFSLPAISKHIKLLYSVGLITIRKNGQKNVVTLNKTSFSVLRDWLSI